MRAANPLLTLSRTLRRIVASPVLAVAMAIAIAPNLTAMGLVRLAGNPMAVVLVRMTGLAMRMSRAGMELLSLNILASGRIAMIGVRGAITDRAAVLKADAAFT